MATPAMNYLALDPSYDPLFDVGTILSGTQAVAQAILTRLKLFQGEWWENLSLGLPMFQTILGQLASARGLQAMQLAVQQVILGTPNVTNITSMDVQFDDNTCRLQITAVVQTAFGEASVSTAPAEQSSIGGA
jgi:hypothetical protein